jgi:predicted dehydrogenase
MNVLLIGYGSIGKKHFQHLLNDKVTVYDIKFSKIKFNKVIKNKKFNFAIVATPPDTHLFYVTKLVKKKIPFLVEKPLSNNLIGWNKLLKTIKKKNIICGVAYPRRNHQFFLDFKKDIFNNKFGKIRLVNCFFSQDFRKYRPDYNKIYYSNPEQGGGLIIDSLIHHINLINFFFKNPKIIFSLSKKLVIKNTKVEDFAHFILRYDNNLIVTFYGNQFQKSYEDKIQFIFEKANITIYRNKNIVEYEYSDKIIIKKNINFDWNKILKSQIINFKKCIINNTQPLTTINQGFADLKLALKIKKISKK